MPNDFQTAARQSHNDFMRLLQVTTKSGGRRFTLLIGTLSVTTGSGFMNSSVVRTGRASHAPPHMRSLRLCVFIHLIQESSLLHNQKRERSKHETN
jgi:hypothetical protein